MLSCVFVVLCVCICVCRVRYGKHKRTGIYVVIKEYLKARVLRQVMEDGVPIAEDAKEEVCVCACLRVLASLFLFVFLVLTR